jgi:hypothetical protein
VGQAPTEPSESIDSGDFDSWGATASLKLEEASPEQWIDTADGNTQDESVDFDGDGWSDDQDCNDLDARIHPGAPEFCDGIDTDCDGVTDPNNAIDAGVWFRDLDGDGFGNSEDTVLSCSHPGPPFVDQGGDCDDTMETVHPGAAEVWDGIDNDCDGGVDSDSFLGVWAVP